MKKRNLILMMTALSLAAVTVRAEDSASEYIPMTTRPATFTSGDYEYKVEKDLTAVIVGYKGEEDRIEIPSEIDGYKVSEIGPEAFRYKKMKSLSVPESVRSIGQQSFEYSVIADALQLPDNVSIGEDAFSYAVLPTEMIIPAGAEVEECAFSYCEDVEQVFIGPDALIKSRGFGYCDDLKEVTCAEGSRLQTNAFEYCRGLERATLCGQVETEKEAFSYCGDVRVVEAAEDDYHPGKLLDPHEPSAGGAVADLSEGWEPARDFTVTKKARAIFDQAMPDHDRMAYDPVAVLATRADAGNDFCYLCRAGVTASSEEPSYLLVYIRQDPEGEVQILEVQDMEFGLTGKSADWEKNIWSDDEYRILLTGDEYLFAECPVSARAGETVTVSTAAVDDGKVELEVNGSELGKWLGWGTYVFTMPAEDVELRAWISTEGYPGA